MRLFPSHPPHGEGRHASLAPEWASPALFPLPNWCACGHYAPYHIHALAFRPPMGKSSRLPPIDRLQCHWPRQEQKPDPRPPHRSGPPRKDALPQIPPPFHLKVNPRACMPLHYSLTLSPSLFHVPKSSGFQANATRTWISKPRWERSRHLRGRISSHLLTTVETVP